MADLFGPRPGESLSQRCRRHADSIDVYERTLTGPIALNLTEIRATLEQVADHLDRSYDDRQREAISQWCPECGRTFFVTKVTRVCAECEGKAATSA